MRGYVPFDAATAKEMRAEIERLRTAMAAAYDALHDDNDASGAEIMLRVALQRLPSAR